MKTKSRLRTPAARKRLEYARDQIRYLSILVTPDVAPKVSIRLRRLLKSVDGALRNARRFEGLP